MKKLPIFLLVIGFCVPLMAQIDSAAFKPRWAIVAGLNANRSMRFGIFEDDQLPGPGLALGVVCNKTIKEHLTVGLSARYTYLRFSENIYHTAFDTIGGFLVPIGITERVHYDRHALSITAELRKMGKTKRTVQRFWSGEFGTTWMNQSRLEDTFLTIGAGPGWMFHDEKGYKRWWIQPLLRGFFWGAPNPHDAHLMIALEIGADVHD